MNANTIKTATMPDVTSMTNEQLHYLLDVFYAAAAHAGEGFGKVAFEKHADLDQNIDYIFSVINARLDAAARKPKNRKHAARRQGWGMTVAGLERQASALDAEIEATTKLITLEPPKPKTRILYEVCHHGLNCRNVGTEVGDDGLWYCEKHIDAYRVSYMDAGVSVFGAEDQD